MTKTVLNYLQNPCIGCAERDGTIAELMHQRAVMEAMAGAICLNADPCMCCADDSGCDDQCAFTNPSSAPTFTKKYILAHFDKQVREQKGGK